MIKLIICIFRGHRWHEVGPWGLLQCSRCKAYVMKYMLGRS